VTAAPLLDRLRRDADAEVARRLDAARARAASIIAELEARLSRQRAERLDAARRDVERETERERAAATARANQLRLAARERFTCRALEAAQERAAARGAQPAVAAWVTRNLDGALECFPPGPLVVRTAPVLASALRSLGERGSRTLEVRPDPSLALGIVVESPDGALRVDATLESVLRAERARLVIELIRLAQGAAS
jgi:vacuolar-type H+-ATPase subunit E/Vma4